MDLGVSLFAGEAEGRLGQVLKDAFAEDLQPLYNFMDDLPNIEGVGDAVASGGTSSSDGGRDDQL